MSLAIFPSGHLANLAAMLAMSRRWKTPPAAVPILAATTLLAACSPSAPSEAADAAPLGPQLVLPVDCVLGETCEIQNYVDRDPGPGAKDYTCATRTYQDHKGVDIRIPDMAAQRAGVDVLAAAPGRVTRLRDGVADVSVRNTGVAAVDGVECGNGIVIDHGDGWESQYCHLAQGSLIVAQDAEVRAGQPIARIGLSGQTEYPHLHFSLRKDGQVVDPFAPEGGEACEARGALWAASVSAAMAYKSGAVLNTGFSSGAVSMESIEDGGLPPASAHAPALVAYVRAIGLEAGDIQHLTVTGPGGDLLAETTIDPLDGPKAQYMLYAGRRTPADGWAPGTYMAAYWVERGGRRALERRFEINLQD
ncbi:M23 family metallopeptidase [Phenylobacterium sp.]|uniref:M23 family metallopeptidase n=1 Tax=Phenylobacterium sp. TaxID=1871053 RepID=UPI002731631B|nr:M23 family metallopeptidase [Phenylobacterium sp.]MDP1617873.1 M23 family metallopeptidase [Phenylobacterium sp.]MDP1987792.1 M23 family metallopeptidase [Phenylobacterium sp.]